MIRKSMVLMATLTALPFASASNAATVTVWPTRPATPLATRSPDGGPPIPRGE